MVTRTPREMPPGDNIKPGCSLTAAVTATALRHDTNRIKTMPQTFLQFPDKCVSYATFVQDVAANVVGLLKKDASDPEYISQNKAFEMFGRGNVERWRRAGKVKPCKRPGKVEYLTAQLRLLQRTQQDYLGR